MLIPSHAKPSNMLIKSPENNSQNVSSLDTDTDQNYVLTPQPVQKDPPLPFQPTQVQTAISPNTFIAQNAGIYSEKQLKHGILSFLLNTLIIPYNSLVKLSVMNL